MKILAWNLNHRAARRTIPKWIPAAIVAQNPDVVVLTEYVEGADHTKFIAALDAAGFKSWSLSPRTPGENQILVASRQLLRRGNLVAPALHLSVPGNFLHVVRGESDLNVLGFRMPSFEGKEQKYKRKVWEWLLVVSDAMRSEPAVIIGDFNTALDDTERDCGDCMKLLASRWQFVRPESGYSWKGGNSPMGRQIDHVFLSPKIPKATSDYLWTFDTLDATAASRKVGIPDHAMLIAQY